MSCMDFQCPKCKEYEVYEGSGEFPLTDMATLDNPEMDVLCMECSWTGKLHQIAVDGIDREANSHYEVMGIPHRNIRQPDPTQQEGEWLAAMQVFSWDLYEIIGVAFATPRADNYDVPFQVLIDTGVRPGDDIRADIGKAITAWNTRNDGKEGWYIDEEYDTTIKESHEAHREMMRKLTG